jgi:branched-chain amino acid transport system ATP-binding protein
VSSGRLPRLGRHRRAAAYVPPGAPDTGVAPLLEVHNLRAGYDGMAVLFDVSFDVRPGEIVIILGGNGAGKSTLLKSIMGTVQVLGGTITFDRENVRHWTSPKRTRRGMSFSPEGRRVFPTLTVKENLFAGASHIPGSELPARLEEVYHYFPVLGERENQVTGTLSGGEQQMVAIGRALMPRPRLLMVEEPSQGLAPVIVDRVYEALQEICLSRSVAIVITEQFQQLRAHDCDRVLVIDKGTVVPYEQIVNR